MNFTPQKLDDALQILHSIIERIRAETGCLSCSVFQDKENECMLVYEEKWKNDETLQRHLRSEEYKKILLVMEMATTHPEIRFDTISHSSGVETIEQARIRKENGKLKKQQD